MKPKIQRTRKIYRVRHMQYMLQLARRAKRTCTGDPAVLQFHVDNYERLLQFELDSGER